MSGLPTYSFLPWYRRGIANTIATADKDDKVAARATTHVELELSGTPVAGGEALTDEVKQDIALYGPGDLVGIEERAILRTEPRNWITNFESNYLAAVDFYDEDFLWRYTPAAPDGSHLRLRPWLTLVVLAEGEFEDGTSMAGRPLPYITSSNADLFPPADDLWAWAHVHFNQSLAGSPQEVVSTDAAAVVGRAQTILDQNPDAGYARLLCPRRLEDDTAYHAFLVPTFETGRLAGIGKDPDDAPFATASAWADYPPGAPKPRQQGSEYPFYFRWYFRTGGHGDFLYLVRLLKPKPVDPRVGVRDMDVRKPGSNVPGIHNLGDVLRLGGALQVPEEDLDEGELEKRELFENWDQPFPRAFQKGLSAFVNLPDDYAAQEAGEANAETGLGPEVQENRDPLITAPLYGKWHSLTQRLLVERDGTPVPNRQGWAQRLNLDPRFRVPAGFGAEVVESNAEQYMNYAWEQIGDVLEANALVRRFHLAAEVSARWYDFHLLPLLAAQPERTLALTAPVQAKILGSPTTVEHLRKSSRVPPVLTSTAFRRVTRPQSRLIRTLPFTAEATPANLLRRVNAGEVTPAPPKTVPGGVVTVDKAAAVAEPKGAPRGIFALLERYPWLPWLLIALGVVLLILLALLLSLVLGIIAFVVLVGLALLLLRWKAADAPAASIEEDDQTPAAVAGLPENPGFGLSEPGAGTSTPTGSGDSAAAGRLKTAIEDSFGLIDASRQVGRQPEPKELDLGGVNETVVAALDPQVTIPRRARTLIQLPPWIADPLVEDFGEVMAYPRIDLPMYEPLKKRSVELFLPNINLIEPNSITLVETNQRFIEAYMVGLNHEFARKLLWREFPSDQRGSYFRQFWDVRSVVNVEGLSENALRKQLYDIPELHRWPTSTKLGTHNNRQSPDEQGKDGKPREQAVLVIRGELLKKYPTAVIYAHRAEWEFEPDGKTPDLTEPRKLVDLEPSEESEPPKEKLRAPLYEAKADPDIYFFGFDLTIDEAMGGSGEPPDTDPGWFFVIKERPGEPRFGLELERDPAPEVLDELTWDDAGVKGSEFLPADSLASFPLASVPKGDSEHRAEQHTADEAALGAAASSARWAYLLFRPPVMVAIHADEMLRSKPS
ncbi:MAG: hypothetical protein ACJ76D_01485 [Solirubrobacterales bacterium]